VPIQRSARDLFSRAAAILFVTRAVAALTDTTPLLQALFDLTTAEAQVAARVAAGQAVEDIARADGKSALTLRNQLRSVMQKTGCRRQVDLVRLLTQLMPGR
jgi:DNA-binding CsgD family transcriptional regulator